jgi:tRNA(fMet)-specific endonuclease VapC
MYALDANTVIHLFKGMGDVAKRFLAVPPAEIALPAVVLHELEVGRLKSRNPERRRRDLEELTRFATILPLGPPEAAAAAQVRADLERTGLPIGPCDVLIAGTALSHRAVLVTHNLRSLAASGVWWWRTGFSSVRRTTDLRRDAQPLRQNPRSPTASASRQARDALLL